jgi:hypothetical protein
MSVAIRSSVALRSIWRLRGAQAETASAKPAAEVSRNLRRSIHMALLSAVFICGSEKRQS